MACASCNCALQTIYFSNDHLLRLSGLTANGDTLDLATIDYQFYDSEDDEIVGADGSLTFVSDGVYEATIDKAIIDLLDSGNEYTIRVTGSQSSIDFEFNLPVRVERRGNS